MNNIIAIFQKEFRSYFVSPIAWVIFCVFLVLSGYFFYMFLQQFMMMCLQAMQYAQYMGEEQAMNINDSVVRPMFGNLSIIILFVLPMMTMRLFAEEKKMGTMEILMTSPVTNTQAVLGKYFASLALFGIMLSLSFVHQLILIVFGQPEIAPIFTAYLGLFLMGATFLALGLWISAFTDNQVVAGFAGFGLFLLLWVIGWAENAAGPVFGKVLGYICIINHYQDFAKGVIDLADLVFFLSTIFVALFLTERTLEAQRWRQ